MGHALIDVYPIWGQVLDAIYSLSSEFEELGKDLCVFHDPKGFSYVDEFCYYWEGIPMGPPDAGVVVDIPDVCSGTRKTRRRLDHAQKILKSCESRLPESFRDRFNESLVAVWQLPDPIVLSGPQGASQIGAVFAASERLLDDYWCMDSSLRRLETGLLGSWGSHLIRRFCRTDLIIYDDPDTLYRHEILWPFLENVPSSGEPRPKLIERNQWIYDMMMIDKTLAWILSELRKNTRGWPFLGSIQAVKNAGRAHAKRFGLPEPHRRDPGRPPGS